MAEQRCFEPILFNMKDESYSDDEDDDLVEIKLLTKTISVSFLQLYKYSPLFHSEFLTVESRESLSRKIIDFQEKFNIKEENTILFFNIIQEENVSITNDSYRDLCKLSNYFRAKKIQKFLDKYSKSYLSEIDSIVFQILDSQKTNSERESFYENVNEELETKLSLKINECLQNHQFKKLPVSIVNRIVSKSDSSNISSDYLFDFINESVEDRYPLFHFLRVKELSDEKYDMLCKNSQKETSKFIYQNIPIDLEYIQSLRNSLSDVENERNNLQISLNEIENERNNIQSQLNDLQNQHNNLLSEHEVLKNEHQNLQNNINIVQQERDNLNRYDKSFADRIRAIIPDQNDDERVCIVERDTRLSYSIRSILPNNPDNEIIIYVGKDVKLSSHVRGIFKSGDDSWIAQQIEDNHNQVKEDANLKSELNEAKRQNEKLNGENQQLQIENNDLKNQISELNKMIHIVTIEHDPNKEFNGIFSYLKKKFGQNNFDEIEITASSTNSSSYSPKNVIDYTNTNCFFSSNIENSWISFHFKKFMIIPTSYTVKATQKYVHPINWTIEGSNDNKDWLIINEQKNCYCIRYNSPFTFNIDNDKPFKFIKMKMNGKESSNSFYYFIIESFEIYGKLITI